MAFISLLIGFAVARLGLLNADHIKRLNKLVIWIILPAVVLSKIHELPLDLHMLKTASAAWLMLLMAIVFWLSAGRIFKMKKEIVAALILTTGFANTSFVGFPLIELLHGKEALKSAVIIDQLGTFFLFSLFGLLIAVLFKKSEVEISFVNQIMKIISFPPFLALLVAGATHELRYPKFLETGLGWISASIAYFTLFIVGYQLKFKYPKHLLKVVSVGLIFKLMLTPFLISLFYVDKIVVLECAMAPMITSTLLAVEFDFAPELSIAMLNLGIIASFVTVPIWSLIL